MTFLQAVHRSPGPNLPPRRLVIHCTDPPPPAGAPWWWASQKGMARSTAVYFTSASSGGSAHRVFDVAGQMQCLRDTTVGWHAPPNPFSLGYEVCGRAAYTREQWLDGRVWPAVVACAAQVRADAHTYQIPVTARLTVPEVAAQARRGVCGHVDVSRAFGQSDHSDPGPGFPWDRFIDLLNPSQEDTVTPQDRDAIVKDVVAALRPLIATHEDMRVLLKGTEDGTHPYNLTSIGLALNIGEKP